MDDTQKRDQDLIRIEDEIIGMGEPDFDAGEPISARTMTPYNDFDEKDVVVLFPDGVVGLSIHAWEALHKPRRVATYMRGRAVAISGSNAAKGTAVISEPGEKSKVVRFSNTLLVRNLGRFGSGAPAFYHALMRGKYLVFLKDNPYYDGNTER